MADIKVNLGKVSDNSRPTISVLADKRMTSWEITSSLVVIV